MLDTFKGYKILMWFSIPFIYAAIWGGVSFFVLGPCETTDQYVRSAVLENLDLNIENIVYVGPSFFHKKPNGEVEVVMKHVIGILSLTIELISSMIIVFYFGIRCYLKIKNLANKSSSVSRSSNLQLQLFVALVTQTLVPVALMHIPVLVIFITAFIGKEMGTASAIVSISIALFPVLDPLPSIFIIKYYRTACYEYYRSILMFFKRFKKKSQGMELRVQAVQVNTVMRIDQRNTY